MCVCACTCTFPLKGVKKKKNACTSNQVIFASCSSCIVYLASPWETNKTFPTWCNNKGLIFPFDRTEKFEFSQMPLVNWDVRRWLVYSQMWHGSGPHGAWTCKEWRLIHMTPIARQTPDQQTIWKCGAQTENSKSYSSMSLPVWYSPPKRLGSTWDTFSSPEKAVWGISLAYWIYNLQLPSAQPQNSCPSGNMQERVFLLVRKKDHGQ